jgi:hypothetical protein
VVGSNAACDWSDFSWPAEVLRTSLSFGRSKLSAALFWSALQELIMQFATSLWSRSNRRLSIAAVLLAAGPASAQSTQRAAFVANNGNLEGSVTAYTFNPDNSLHFVNKYVTGSTPSTSQPVPGTNAYTISITPNGTYLATGHTTSLTTEQITILRVNADASVRRMACFRRPTALCACAGSMISTSL